jgi:hypothetical protein
MNRHCILIDIGDRPEHIYILTKNESDSFLFFR